MNFHKKASSSFIIAMRLFFFIGIIVSLPNLGLAEPAESFSINGQTVPKIVATVNGKDLGSVVLKNQLQTYRMVSNQRGHQITSQEEAKFAKEALSKMVDQELVFQETQKLNIQIEPKSIDDEIQKITKQFPSEEMFRIALKAQGLNIPLLRKSLERQLAEEEYIRKQVAPKVNVSDEEAKAFYDKNSDQFQQPEKFTLYHIFVVSVSPKPEELPKDPDLRKKAESFHAMMDEDAKTKIEKIKTQLKEGSDFEALAKELSEDDRSGKNGGLLGSVTPGDVFPEMAKVMVTMKTGEISDIVKTSYGYHILKLKEKIPESLVEFDQVKADILNVLFKEAVAKQREEQLKTLRKEAKIKIFYK